MTKDFRDRIVVITGAASGIGRAIAKAAASDKPAGLLITDVDPTGLRKTHEDLRDVVDAESFVADLRDAASPAKIINAAKARFGRVDGLVNAAGITTRASAINSTSEVFDSVFSINVRAPLLLMKHTIRDMLARNEAGSIVNIQSMNAHCGAPDLAIYAASKGALQTLTKNVANAHLRDRIRVNGLNLGWTWTEAEHITQTRGEGQPDSWAEMAGTELPLGRLLNAEEATRAALYLLGPASEPMTGVAIDLEQWIAGAPP